ncbi:MAG: sugar ABC transporter substrate-binding protein [Spirochaetota bacterium]
MKKRIGLVFLLALLATSLNVWAAPAKQLTYGYIAYDMKDIWNQYGAEAFQYAAKLKGVNVIVLDSENDAEKSVGLMQELIAKKVDGISVFPISPDQAATLIRMANEAKIPITIENLPMKENAGKYISVVACRYDDIGYGAIKYIATSLPGSKVLFVAGAEGGGVWETYMIGVNKALAEFKGKVTMVDIIHGDWQTQKAMDVTQSFLSTGKAFDVVFANNDLMAIGVFNALKDKGLDGKKKIVSTGGSPDGLKMIKDGIEYANITAPVSLQGLITFRNLWWNSVGKKKPAAFYPLPIVPVDVKTLGKAIKWDAVDKASIDYIGGLD